ncbi:MAG TPA: type I-MYXAN CRISPR-associated protein Cas5/Cmx5/DevS [Acidobacteriota bacterium]|nr:type I-MYXAN CRISPR-associated protein Cas5/Cmx5/DevS [Acidobacteriota bacterium]
MIVLNLEVPIACFRQSRAREYAETYPVPPPSTIYGLLLSLVGETDRYKHPGTQLALAQTSLPKKSTVIRTFRRLKKKEILDSSNARPDYQELLTDIRLLVCVLPGEDQATPTLYQRLKDAFLQPDQVERFGGLSLGESRDLVNSISLLTESQLQLSARWILQEEDGLLALPVWVDHVGSRGTRWRRYSVQPLSPFSQPPAAAWTTISPT